MVCPNQVSLDSSQEAVLPKLKKRMKSCLGWGTLLGWKPQSQLEFYLRHPHSLGSLLQQLCSPLISARCCSPLRSAASYHISVTISCISFLRSLGWKEVWGDLPDPPCHHSMQGTAASASTTAAGKNIWEKVINKEIFSQCEVPSWLVTPRASISGLPT